MSDQDNTSGKPMSVDEKRELLKDMEITYTSKRIGDIDEAGNVIEDQIASTVEEKRALLDDMEITYTSTRVGDVDEAGNIIEDKVAQTVEEKRELLDDMEITYTSKRVSDAGSIEQQLKDQADSKITSNIEQRASEKLGETAGTSAAGAYTAARNNASAQFAKAQQEAAKARAQAAVENKVGEELARGVDKISDNHGEVAAQAASTAVKDAQSKITNPQSALSVDEKRELLKDMDISYTSKRVSDTSDIPSTDNIAAPSTAAMPTAKEATQQTSTAGSKMPPLAMAINTINKLVIGSQISLQSDFAQTQFKTIAARDNAPLFMAAMIEIFGHDIPADAYHQLHVAAINDDAVLTPKYDVELSLKKNALAQFHAPSQTISVLESFLKAATTDNDKSGELMIALVEEYGHFIDHLLRNHFSDIGSDAEGDEGAKFAYHLFTLNALEQSQQVFGEANIDGQIFELNWDYTPLHEALVKHVNEQRQATEDKTGDYEFFKAGVLKPHGHYGHGNIEKNALEKVLTKDSLRAKDKDLIATFIDQIYLGNWLRDFSQAVDPMIIRPMSTGLKAAGQNAPNNGSWLNNLNPFADIFKPFYQAADMHPVMLSVEMVTSAIELAAAKEFLHDSNQTKATIENYEGHLKTLRKDYIAITPDVLGAYRPEEHIDNPKGLGHNEQGKDRGDKKIYDKFTGFVPNDASLHDIGSTYGLKNYIRSTSSSYTVDGGNLPTAYSYIVSQLTKAAKTGGLNDPKCLVEFGAALHTLEDYFAHTNFAEVSLIKSVEPLVFPWVDEVKETGFKYNYRELFEGRGFDDKYCVIPNSEKAKQLKGKHRLAAYIPIVTGTFGSVDTAASVLPILNEHLFNIEITPWEKAKPGERTFSDILIREMFADIDNANNNSSSGANGDKAKGSKSNYKGSFDELLVMRDKFVKFKDYAVPDWVERSIHWVLERARLLLNFSTFIIIKSMGSTLNDAQLAMGKDLKAMAEDTFRIGSDPSHTQVAKDDPHQATHGLAAALATRAVERIAKPMLNVWYGRGSLTAVIKELDDIMQHPVECDWQDAIVVDWAAKNPKKVCQAISPSVVIDGLLHQNEEIEKIIEDINKNLPRTAAATLTQVNKYYDTGLKPETDLKQMELALNEAKNIHQQQTREIKQLQRVWDEKFPKPEKCGVYGYHTDHPHDNEETDDHILYFIEPGDTLWALSRDFGCTVDEIKALNNLTSDTIIAGKTLKIPKGAD